MNRLGHGTKGSLLGHETTRTTPARDDMHSIAAESTAHATWQINPATSRVAFTIGKRLLFVKKLTVTGQFADVRGTIRLDERDPLNSQAEVTIGTASIDTGNARRDAHLRTADFFDVERYPTLRFASRRIDAINVKAGQYRVTGDLTIRDVTREVQLQAGYTPAETGAGAPRISLTLITLLSRHDFGISWSSRIINIADELNVMIEVQATRQR